MLAHPMTPAQTEASSALLGAKVSTVLPLFAYPLKMDPEPSLKFATLNVRGLSRKRKQSQVYRLLTDRDIDVLTIQETKVEGEG